MSIEIKAVSGKIEAYAADAIILTLFEEGRLSDAHAAVDKALGGAIGDVVREGDFSGKAGQTTVLYTRGGIPAKRVILVGLGKQETFSIDSLRRAAAAGILKARELKVRQAASVLPSGLEAVISAQAITEGSWLALYAYHGQKSSEKPEAFPDRFTLVTAKSDVKEASEGIRCGMAIGAGVQVARDLVNMPPNVCTPAFMAEVAGAMAKSVGLKIEVLDRRQMEALQMGALLGVAQGSDTPPKFIILEHNAGKTKLPTVVLIGKGVTFDTGGYDIKTSEGMGTMKGDMAGGAAVIGAMGAIAGLGLPLHVVGLIPAADNMISGHAYRPQEVLKASNGVTIEITSTDAEGRLLLADALVYAKRYKPSAVVDIATLTGSAVIALGQGVAAGLFSTDERLRDTLLAAGGETGEKVWPLPLYDEYEKAIESNTADIKNTGGRYGGVGTSAIFLKHFVDYPTWAHIDMAGMNFDAPDNPYMPKGATGYGVRLLTEFVKGWGTKE